MTGETKPLILFDRSRVVADWKCPRARFWGYEFEGRGIGPNTTSLELWMGTAIHEALAYIAQCETSQVPVDIDQVASEAGRAMRQSLLDAQTELDDDARMFAEEQGALVEGLVRGFYRQVWPRLRAEYPTIIAVEGDILHPASPGMGFMSKPDLVVADQDDNWWYWEYKSTSSKKQEWIDSWNTAVQIHSTIEAIERKLNHPVTGVVVQGLYKGYESYGRQNSPLIYAYVKPGQPPFVKEQVQYEYKAGFRAQPVWLRDGGVKKWVEEMPEEMLADQFPQTPPIFVKKHLIEAFFRQTVIRERRIAAALEELGQTSDELAKQAIMDEVFPQRFDQCTPPWGKRKCQFRRLCHGVVSDPLSEGFVWREPHHEFEKEE